VKYILSFKTKFGAISAESENPRELAEAYTDLREVAKQISNYKRSTRPIQLSVVRRVASRKSRGSAKGETTAILSELQAKVLGSNFFSTPRTTGETRERLLRVSGKHYTSRKVSQALGILKDKGMLNRTGKRNYYVYSD
jgi:hypothetical protein